MGALLYPAVPGINRLPRSTAPRPPGLCPAGPLPRPCSQLCPEVSPAFPAAGRVHMLGRWPPVAGWPWNQHPVTLGSQSTHSVVGRSPRTAGRALALHMTDPGVISRTLHGPPSLSRSGSPAQTREKVLSISTCSPKNQSEGSHLLPQVPNSGLRCHVSSCCILGRAGIGGAPSSAQPAGQGLGPLEAPPPPTGPKACDICDLALGKKATSQYELSVPLPTSGHTVFSPVGQKDALW